MLIIFVIKKCVHTNHGFTSDITVMYYENIFKILYLMFFCRLGVNITLFYFNRWKMFMEAIIKNNTKYS